MRMLLVVAAVVFLTDTASADLASDEREFGEYFYKSLRTVHDQTCTCKGDGNCRLTVSRDDLREQLRRLNETAATMVPRAWPDLAKKFAALSPSEARALGQAMGQAYLLTLPREDVLLWMRMLSSCWGVSAEPQEQGQGADPSKAWRSGSLTASQWGKGFLRWSEGYTDDICECADAACVDRVAKRWDPAMASAVKRAPELIRLATKHGSSKALEIFQRKALGNAGRRKRVEIERRGVACLQAAGLN